MNQSLTWNEYLEAIAEHLTMGAPYICCHIDGRYLEGDYIEIPSKAYIENPSKAYLKAVGEGCKSHAARLLEIINKELAELYKGRTDFFGTTLSRKLGDPYEDGVQGRQDWLRSLKD